MCFDWADLLANHADVIAAAAAEPDLTAPAAIDRLNRVAGEPAARAAVELTLARQKLAAKWPGGGPLVADITAAEQATDRVVAEHKAKRFAAAGIGRIADLCCGIGGDAIALAVSARVDLFDQRPDRAWAARHNVLLATGRCAAAAATDVRRLELNDVAFHIDPSRRAGTARLNRYTDYQPGPGFIDALLERCPTGAVKLGPGIDLDEVRPGQAQPGPAQPGELEFISHAGSLVQAVLWCGELQRAARSATMLPAGATIQGESQAMPFDDAGDWLFAVDASVERAGLIGNLCDALGLAATHPQLGLLTGPSRVDSPFLTAFEHIETLPWRTRKIKQWLASHDGGIVEVKTRGKATDPDRAQRDLRGEGATMYTLFVLRYDRRVVCHITRRADASAQRIRCPR